MKNLELNLITHLLSVNPNIGRLKNVHKILILRYLTQVKNELKIFSEAQIKTLETFKLVKGEKGDYEESKKALEEKSPAQYKKLDKALYDLGMMDVAGIGSLELPEEEFFLLTNERKSKLQGQEVDFFYSISEVEFLASHLLAKTKKAK